MSNIAIRAEDISKMYHLGVIGYGTLKDDLAAAWARLRGKEDPNTKVGEKSRFASRGEFWALDGITFEVEQGARLGIIGRNGAGKSTLLKILSRVTSPTTGTVKIKGRVSSLLEVGTGFHPELTGRENVFLNGAILGMKRREIQRKFDEIVEFSGVADFIDTPIKRYSSGMFVRLAFSVAAHLESDILILDEVLSVGDGDFQRKSLQKMEDLSINQGKTIIFVSHAMHTVARVCQEVIGLADGRISLVTRDKDEFVRWYNGINPEEQSASEWNKKDEQFNNRFFSPVKMELQEKPSPSGESVLRISGIVGEIENDLTIGFSIYDDNQTLLFISYFTDIDDINSQKLRIGKNTLACVLPFDFLNVGKYRIDLCGGIHNKEWLFEPGQPAPCIYFEKKAINSLSRFYDIKRPTMIAPLLVWTVRNEE